MRLHSLGLSGDSDESPHRRPSKYDVENNECGILCSDILFSGSNNFLITCCLPCLWPSEIAGALCFVENSYGGIPYRVNSTNPFLTRDYDWCSLCCVCFLDDILFTIMWGITSICRFPVIIILYILTKIANKCDENVYK